MPMPQTYSPCPRPILKRANLSSATHDPIHKDESNQLLSIDPSILSPMVRFPHSRALSSTFAAYPSSTYDRSPIVVSPNRCSLPERGCPGRTYLPGEAPHPRSRPSQNGKCLHPRASSSTPLYPFDDEDEDDNDLTPKPTPIAYSRPLPQPPALVPDISSSESEESDGFASHYSSSASDLSLPGTFLLLSILTPHSSFLSDISSLYVSKPSSFLPHPHQHPSRARTPSTAPSIPNAPLLRHPTSPTRSTSPSTRRRHTSPSRSPRRAQRSSALKPGDVLSPHETKYKTFSENSMLTSCSLAVPDMGCFGGFWIVVSDELGNGKRHDASCQALYHFPFLSLEVQDIHLPNF